MKKLLFLVILVVVGCTSINKKIEKIFKEPLESSSKINEIIELYKDPKIENNDKKFIIKNLSKVKSDNANICLKQLFKLEKDKSNKEKILKAIIKQKNSSNIQFFFNLMEENTEYNFAKQISDFGLEYFKDWEMQLLTDNKHIVSVLNEIIDNLDEHIYYVLFEKYLASEQIFKKKLFNFLKRNPEIIPHLITDFLQKEKIDSYEQIEEIALFSGYKYLKNYKKLFQNPMDNLSKETVINIISSFKDNCLISLNLDIYSNIDSLENQKILFKICETINTRASLKILEKWLQDSDSSFEQKEIILSIKEITTSVPDVFINLLEKTDIQLYLLSTFSKYLKTDINSVVRSFGKSSDTGKLVLIDYFIKNSYSSVMQKIIPILKNSDSYIKKFTIVKLIQADQKKPMYTEFIKTMLNSNNKEEYELAFEYAGLSKLFFSQFLFENYDLLIENQAKEYFLIKFFKECSERNYQNLLLEKYIANYANNSKLCKIYANTIINNHNLDIDAFKSFFAKESMIISQKAFCNIIAEYKSGVVLSSEISNYIYMLSNSYFSNLDFLSKTRIFSYMVNKQDLMLLNHFVNIYEQLNLLEKNYFNNMITNFALIHTNKHIEKIIMLGDSNDLEYYEDVLLNKFKDRARFNNLSYAMLTKYFQLNNFSKFDFYLERLDKKDYKYLLEMKIIRNSIPGKKDFHDYYYQNYQNIPNDYLIIFKSMIDSLNTVDYIINNHGIVKVDSVEKYHEIELRLKSQVNDFNEILINNFNYYPYNDKENFIENEFIFSINQISLLENLKCGNITLESDDDSIFLSILLKVVNNSPKAQSLYLDYFEINSKNNNYHLNWKNNFYNDFLRKNVRNINEFKSGQKIYLPMVFEINVNDIDLTLHYDNNSVLNIVTPIKLQIDNFFKSEVKIKD
ncbi:MAG: hypothetical protein K8S23_16490 [Candidatus Cloacimonetes bacterium]|nr:hypothetical protein [Candidatus Cloacimonadota bacterium]